MKHYIYARYTLDAGRLFYTRKGTRSRHCKSTGRNLHWNRIVAKHGFRSKILITFDSSEEALSHEIEIIGLLKDMGAILCNLTSGGEGTVGVTLSEAHKAAISAAQKGNKNTRGRTLTASEKEQLRIRQTGVKRTDDTKRKIGATKIGNTYCVGRVLSEESKEKMRQAWERRREQGIK